MKGLNSFQLSEWQMYDRIDPIGEWRNDFRFADFEALIINTVRMLYAEKGKIVDLVTAKDLMPEWGKVKKVEPKRNNEQIKEMFKRISKITGNPIKTKKNEHR